MEVPREMTFNLANEYSNNESILIPFSCQYQLGSTEIVKSERNDDFVEDTLFGDNFGVVPLEYDDGASVYNGIEDYFAADIGVIL